jgi:hypothetical protein
MSAQDDESAPGSESESESESEVQTGSLVTQSLPHTYRREGLEFEVDEFRLDGTPLGDRGELNTSDRRLSLVDEANWETLSIDGSVTLDQETIQDVFPPDEWGKVPGRLVLVKTNPLGIHRSRDILAEPPIEPDDVSFSVEIDRTEYRGTLTVEPFLTRARAGDPGATSCASKVGARLADGVPWTVQLDDPTDGGGLLMPIIEDFGESDRLPDEQHIHHLSLDEPRNPQLFLNSEHQRVINILQNEGAVGGPPRLRDVLYGYIEHSVWTQLLVQTARDTDEDTGETEYDWQEDVLEIFLNDLYPDVEADQAAAQLATDVRSSEDLPDLMQRIEQAVHQRYDLPHDTTNLIEEAIQDGD